MSYKLDSKVFEKITVEGIKSNPETMAFLRRQASEIFEDERLVWEASQNDLNDITDKNLWCEYSMTAERKLEKYLYRWFDDIKHSIGLTVYEEKLPFEIVEIFRRYIQEVVSFMNFEELAYELNEEVFIQYMQNHEGASL